MDLMLLPSNALKPRVSRLELVSAIDSLRDALSDGQLDQLQPAGPAAVYTPAVTLWMLIMQRIQGGQSLERTVKDFIAHRPEFCPQNKRIDQATLSSQSSAYAGARKRLDLSVVTYLFNRITDSIVYPKLPLGHHPRKTFLLDGTTMTLAPSEELKRHFPPATNQHGEAAWPVMLLFVAHDLQSGCAVVPEVGRMYGGKGDSEALLADRIVGKLPRGSIVMADAGLGIFRVAYSCAASGHDFLFRLTADRFASMTKRATLISSRWKSKTWRLDWSPNSRECRRCPGLPADAKLRVSIHEVELDNGTKLFLVTTLDEDSHTLSQRYAHRYDVEGDIRSIKVAMNVEQIAAKSKEMVLKELYTSLIAYNLVIQLRRQAAELAGVAPRRLSFQGVWDTYASLLAEDLLSRDAASCVEQFEAALTIASDQLIPNRPGRNYRRAAHPRRQKTTKWQKAQRNKDQSKPNREEKPPNILK